MKLDEVESTLKHPVFMNVHLQILSKRKYKEEYHLLPWEFNIVGYYNINNDPKNNVINNDPKTNVINNDPKNSNFKLILAFFSKPMWSLVNFWLRKKRVAKL